MSDCEKNINIIPEHVEEVSEENIADIDETLIICPDLENEFEEAMDEIPPLPIDLPDMNQINPFKKIRKHNRIKNTIIITIVSIIVIVAAIFITKYLNYKSGKVIYCQANPVVVFEAIIDSFSSPDYTPNLSLVISENNGHFLDINNHYFEIYDADNDQFYQVKDDEIGDFNNISVRISPITKKEHFSATLSLTSITTILEYVLKNEVFDESKMHITFHPTYSFYYDIDYIQYYFDATNNTFIEAKKFANNATGHNICLIYLQEPKVEIPSNGVLMEKDMNSIKIAVLY